MGHLADFKCKKCANIFESQEGGGFLFEEYRCENCDEIKRVELKGKNKRTPKSPLGKCEKCSGKLKSGLRPMCQKCKCRDVEIVKVKIYYD